MYLLLVIHIKIIFKTKHPKLYSEQYGTEGHFMLVRLFFSLCNFRFKSNKNERFLKRRVHSIEQRGVKDLKVLLQIRNLFSLRLLQDGLFIVLA